jgi:hypothetical protein
VLSSSHISTESRRTPPPLPLARGGACRAIVLAHLDREPAHPPLPLARGGARRAVVLAHLDREPAHPAAAS